MTSVKPTKLAPSGEDWPQRLTERLGGSVPSALQAVGPLALLAPRKIALFCCPDSRQRYPSRPRRGPPHARGRGYGHQRLPLANREGMSAHSPAREAAHHHLPGPSHRADAHPDPMPRRVRRRPCAVPVDVHEATEARHEGLRFAPERVGRRSGGRGLYRTRLAWRPDGVHRGDTRAMACADALISSFTYHGTPRPVPPHRRLQRTIYATRCPMPGRGRSRAQGRASSKGSLMCLVDPDAILRGRIVEFLGRGDFGLASGPKADGGYERV
jgi:hypothetical protein